MYGNLERQLNKKGTEFSPEEKKLSESLNKLPYEVQSSFNHKNNSKFVISALLSHPEALSGLNTKQRQSIIDLFAREGFSYEVKAALHQLLAFESYRTRKTKNNDVDPLDPSLESTWDDELSTHVNPTISLHAMHHDFYIQLINAVGTYLLTSERPEEIDDVGPDKNHITSISENPRSGILKLTSGKHFLLTQPAHYHEFYYNVETSSPYEINLFYFPSSKDSKNPLLDREVFIGEHNKKNGSVTVLKWLRQYPGQILHEGHRKDSRLLDCRIPPKDLLENGSLIRIEPPINNPYYYQYFLAILDDENPTALLVYDESGTQLINFYSDSTHYTCNDTPKIKSLGSTADYVKVPTLLPGTLGVFTNDHWEIYILTQLSKYIPKTISYDRQISTALLTDKTYKIGSALITSIEDIEELETIDKTSFSDIEERMKPNVKYSSAGFLYHITLKNALVKDYTDFMKLNLTPQLVSGLLSQLEKTGLFFFMGKFYLNHHFDCAFAFDYSLKEKYKPGKLPWCFSSGYSCSPFTNKSLGSTDHSIFTLSSLEGQTYNECSLNSKHNEVFKFSSLAVHLLTYGFTQESIYKLQLVRLCTFLEIPREQPKFISKPKPSIFKRLPTGGNASSEAEVECDESAACSRDNKH